MADAQPQASSPFERIGGKAPIARVVDRFYDLMESDPDYAGLRAMHAADLAPMRASLTDFLAAWMGGPRDWFDERPGACIMSAHAGLGITRETADQWLAAMARALDETSGDGPLREAMLAAFGRMAAGMARLPA